MRPRLASWPLWWLPAQSPGRCGSSRPGRRGAAGRRGTARSRMPLRHSVALWTLPRLLIFPRHDKSPARAGLFISSLNRLYLDLTSNDDASNDDASSGGASDGDDASPNTCDANGGGANPSAGDASPSGGDANPSALLPA